MSKGSYFLIAAALLMLLGLAVSAEQLAVLLVADAGPLKLPLIRDGALFLKILLTADALLLLSFGLYYRRQTDAGVRPSFVPLWTPPPSPFAARYEFSAYPLILFAVLAIALILRLIALNSDLWIDEVLTLVNFIRLPLGEIVTDYSSDNHHPFFSFLAHISVALFGESAWAIRLPALVFGVGSIAAAMQLGRYLYGSRVAVYTGLLLTLSYHHVWFSQNARGYSILLFGTILSTLYLLRALESGKWRYWLAYAIVIAFSAWAHITAVFVSIAHAVVVLLLLLRLGRFKDSAWLPLAGFVFAAWLTLHLYALMLPQMLEFFAQPGAGTGLVQTEWRSPLWLISEAFNRLGIGAALGWVGSIGLLTVAGLYAWWFARHDWVFLLLAVLPGLLLGTTMFALGRNLWPRMFFNEIGFVLMLIVVAVMLTVDVLRRKFAPRIPRWSRDIPVLVLAAVLLTGLPAVYRYPKQDFSGARDFVREQMTADDRAVGIHMAGRIYSRYYATDWPEVNSVAQLKQQQSIEGDTWVLYTLPGFLDTAFPEISRHLQADYEYVRSFPGTLGNGEIIVYRSK